MHNFLRLSAISFSLLLPLSVSALELHSAQWLGLVDKDGSGAYQTLLNTMSDELGLESAQLHIAPIVRSLTNFFSNKSSCIIGGDSIEHATSESVDLISSENLSRYNLHVFTLRDQPIIYSFQGLADEFRIAGLRGLKNEYATVIPREVSIEYGIDDLQNIKLLEKGRVHALLGFMPDFQNFIDTVHYDKNFIVLAGVDRIHCHRSVEKTIYIKKLNSALQQLKSDGRYQEIMRGF